jgi:hypothetical protein
MQSGGVHELFSNPLPTPFPISRISLSAFHTARSRPICSRKWLILGIIAAICGYLGVKKKKNHSPRSWHRDGAGTRRPGRLRYVGHPQDLTCDKNFFTVNIPNWEPND